MPRCAAIWPWRPPAAGVVAAVLLRVFVVSPPDLASLLPALKEAAPVLHGLINPVLLIAFFTGLTWVIHRRWQPCAVVVAGFLFILNQDYWKETTETLSLVAFVCLICMAIGCRWAWPPRTGPGSTRRCSPSLT